MCYIICMEQSCCRVADLYSYIEWGWCWWTKNRLILKTWWLLVCSFLHCWHSFLRFWSNAIYIENHPHNFDRFRVAFLCSLYRSTPCGRLLLFYYQYSISGSRIQELLQYKSIHLKLLKSARFRKCWTFKGQLGTRKRKGFAVNYISRLPSKY